MGYVDPGAFGILSQIGYVVLFSVGSVLMFFFEPIKKGLYKLNRCKQTEDVEK